MSAALHCITGAALALLVSCTLGPASAQAPGRWPAADNLSPVICADDPARGFEARLALDAMWSVDPLVGRTSASASRMGALPSGVARMLEGKPGAALLVTFSASDGGCAWLVTADGIQAYGRTSRTSDDLSRDIVAMLAALDITDANARRTPRLPGEAAPLPTATVEPSAVVLERIVNTVAPGPVRHALGGVTKLVIATSQPLYAFPFSLLPLENGTPLGVTAAVQLTPSINAMVHASFNEPDLATMSAGARRAALRNALIVGNSVFADRIYTDAPPLPGAEREVRGVAEILHARALVGPAATLDAIAARTRRAPPPYIHLAGHGLASQSGGLRSDAFVMLSGGDRIYSPNVLPMGADPIVVLSACQSGLGTSRDGGIMGLPREFLLSNARAVVMSHWSVDDDATLYLMTHFAEALVETGQPTVALATAMRATRAVYPQPSSWAAFSVVSTMAP